MSSRRHLISAPHHGVSRQASSWQWLPLLAMLAMLTNAIPAHAEEAAPPAHASFNEEVIRIPGDAPPAVTLQVTLMRPDGPGPFPLAVMNHGATGVSATRRGQRYHLTNAAFYFLSRGYAVALPMMRGFSTSGGELYHFGCDYAAAGLANARDIAGVIHHLASDSRFDTRRVIVAGQSAGGWNTLAVGALGLPNVAGLINFNGGVIFSDCGSGPNSLASGAAAFAARTPVPSIWFYGDNDSLFPPSVWRTMHARYTEFGGKAELVDVGTVMRDSHNFLSYPEVLGLWTARADAFLARIGMPHNEVSPGDLPMAFPPTAGSPQITDPMSAPYLNDKGREHLAKFLKEPMPRAFVLGSNGAISTSAGGFDPLGRAMDACRNTGAQCIVYAVDDRLVARPSQGEPPERSYTVTVGAGRTTTINFAVRLNADCSPHHFAAFRVTEKPRHGAVETIRQKALPHFPPESPYAACNHAPADGVAVTYTPSPNFTGDDSFVVIEDRPEGGKSTAKFAIVVKRL